MLGPSLNLEPLDRRYSDAERLVAGKIKSEATVDVMRCSPTSWEWVSVYRSI